jgi:hypothetical protein
MDESRDSAVSALAGDTASNPIVVLRCADEATLGTAVSDCVWSLSNGRMRELIIPAGPYRYGYAAARTIAQSIPECRWRDPEEGLSRTVMSSALRTLLRMRLIIGIPRLDKLDAESVQLLASLMRFGDLCRRLDFAPGLRLVVGITTAAPTAGMKPLLEVSGESCSDVKGQDASKAPAIPAKLRPLLSVLAAAPHPLTLADLARCAGKAESVVEKDLERWTEYSVVEGHERIGQGSAFSLFEHGEAEVGLGRRLLLERGDLRLPEARLVVSRDMELSTQLCNRALDRGEPAVALKHLQLGGSVTKGDNPGRELKYALALARTGVLEGARAIYFSHVDTAESPDEVLTLAQLAAELHMRGILNRTQADQTLRRGDRDNRDQNLGAAIELRALRAAIMIRNDDLERALTYLRRTSKQDLAKVPTRSRVRYHMAQVLVQATADNRRYVERTLRRSLALAKGSQLVREVADTGVQVLPGDEQYERLLMEASAANLDYDKVQRVLGNRLPIWLHELFDSLFPLEPGAEDAPPAGGALDLFRWLKSHGATLLALWGNDELKIFPAAAANDPGLKSWIETNIQRLRQYPGVCALPCHPIPNAGVFAGDLVLVARRWEQYGPLLVVLRRDQLGNLHHLYAALDSRN